MLTQGPKMRLIQNFLTDESGATAIEYSMIGGLVSILILAAIQGMGTTITDMFIGPVADALAPRP